MNIEIANRLLELRKKNGYSQEELASKLGISRQSVSKWERAEASPDTDNLILLAKIYNVSLDELLGASSVDVEELRSNNEVVEENTQKFDKKVKKYSLIDKTISTIILSASVITYILLGSLLSLWHPYWVVFLFGIALDSLIDVILYKDFNKFAYPVALCAAYILIGHYIGGWHPYWVLFLTVPVYYALAKLLNRAFHFKEDKKFEKAVHDYKDEEEKEE